MEIEFVQKRRFGFRKHILTSDKIFVETTEDKENVKYEVRLDKLGFSLHYHADSTIPRIMVLGICAFFILFITIEYFVPKSDVGIGTLIFVYLGGMIFASIFYLIPRRDNIYLVGGQKNLVFYRNVPDEKTVLEFIEKVKTQTKTYYKEKYTTFNSTTTEQEYYSILHWLQDIEVITQSEYAEYKANFDTQRLL